MKKRCVIFGANDFGSMIKFYAEKYMDISIEAYTLDQKYIVESVRDGIPIEGFETLQEKYPPDTYSMILAIGYKSMNDIRKEKYYQAKQKGYYIENVVHPSAILECTQIGEGNIILENVVMAYGTQVGNANIFWNGCQISHESRVGDFNYFAPASIIAGKTIVKNNCFLGIQSAVRGNRILEDYTLIGAGAYMNHSTQKEGVYVPARTVRLENKKSKDFF